VLQGVAGCCRVLQFVAGCSGCCRVLQCVWNGWRSDIVTTDACACVCVCVCVCARVCVRVSESK